MKFKLSDEDIITLQKTTDNEVAVTHQNKRKPDGQLKDATDSQQRIVFPAFDLSTKIIGFDNGFNRVTTIAYEIKCHPVHSTLLKCLLIKLSVLDPIHPFDSNIHFIPHGLIQFTDATTVKTQITQQNHFLTQTGIVPIFSIPETTMNLGIKNRLLDIPSVIGFEPTYLTKSSGK